MTARTVLFCTGFILLCLNDLAINVSCSAMQRVPATFPLNITKLNLSSSLISEADVNTLQKYTLLTEIHLDNNRIATVHVQMFAGLSQLSVLNLSHNIISTIKPRAFYDLVNMKTLDLSYNLIKFLPPKGFASLWNLETLLLQGNGLQSLEHGIFSKNTKHLRVNLEGDRWNCSCAFMEQVKQMKSTGLQILSPKAACTSPAELAGRSIMGTGTTCCLGSPGQHCRTKPLGKDLMEVTPPVANTWKFVAGVLVTTLSASMLLLCAIKSPSWYNLLLQYRHQRLTEYEPDVLSVQSCSSFTLESEHTEAGRQDDEDGYIEDCYIDTAPVPGDGTSKFVF